MDVLDVEINAPVCAGSWYLQLKVLQLDLGHRSAQIRSDSA